MAGRLLRRQTVAAKWRSGLTDPETVEVLDLQDELRRPGEREHQLDQLRRLCYLVVKARHDPAEVWFEDHVWDLLCGLLTGGYFDLWRGQPRAKWRLWLQLRLYELEKPEHRHVDACEQLALLGARHAGDMPHDPTGVGLTLTAREARRKFKSGKLPILCIEHDGSTVSAALWQALDRVLAERDPDTLIAGYGALSEIAVRDSVNVIRAYDKAQSKIPVATAKEKGCEKSRAENRAAG